MELPRHTSFATTMDLYSRVIPALKWEATEQPDRIQGPWLSNRLSKGKKRGKKKKLVLLCYKYHYLLVCRHERHVG